MVAVEVAEADSEAVVETVVEAVEVSEAAEAASAVVAEVSVVAEVDPVEASVEEEVAEVVEIDSTSQHLLLHSNETKNQLRILIISLINCLCTTTFACLGPSNKIKYQLFLIPLIITV